MTKSTDSEKYEVVSKVRPGFRREYLNACKTHSEICGGSTSLSRTRPRKNRNVVHVPEPMRTRNGVENIGVAQNGVLSEEDARSEVEDETFQPVREIGETSRDRRLKVSTKVNKFKPAFSNSKKFPSKLKDLLDSAVLDGLKVKYVRGIRVRKPGEKDSPGVIKTTGIECYCDICKGVEVVSPAIFEVHAGSANKRPPEYTFLENGNTVRCVMNAFLNSPIDKMEDSVHAVLGNFTMQKSKFCLNCRDPKVVSRLFCIACEELKACQPSPTRTTETIISCVSPPPPSPAIPRSPEPAEPQKPSYKGMKYSAASDKRHGKITRKDQHLHKLVFQALEHGADVTYIARGEKLLDGKINRYTSAIMCSCCDNQISPSTFEAHAGWASRRKPYLHIFAGGVSLHELSISLLKKQKISRSADSDGRCSICEQGGHLLCCDGCPRAFHLECVPLKSEPRCIWYCKYCCHNVYHNERREERNANAQDAVRVAEMAPLEQIAQRAPLTVNDTEAVEGGCPLCREDDFQLKGFGPRTVIICDQCNKEYHVGCLKDHKIADLKKLPKGDWFCGSECLQVRTVLHNLVIRGDVPISDSLLSLIKKKHKEKGLKTNYGLDVKWRIMNWKLLASEEIRALLSKAVSIFHEQFDPIVDADTDIDFIPSMIYGRSIKDQYFGGMYCAVLTVNKEVVSTGVFRMFGREVAELPLVATNAASQGKGYFQALFACIEGLLGELKIERLFLPAAHEAESLWTGKFGFMALDQDETNFYTSLYRVMMFNGAALLQKPVPRPAITEYVAEDPFEACANIWCAEE
ncbi:uncharacterized protein LOC127106299 isoform X7 [Lathyrus oleraceus]|nr:uncharacterized protein LOC127106299 isoform X7 [Pisum sativum]